MRDFNVNSFLHNLQVLQSGKLAVVQKKAPAATGLSQQGPWEDLRLSDSQTIGAARRRATPAVRRRFQFAIARCNVCLCAAGNVMASDRRPVDNVDSRVRSQTYGLKKNCTAFSAVRG